MCCVFNPGKTMYVWLSLLDDWQEKARRLYKKITYRVRRRDFIFF